VYDIIYIYVYCFFLLLLILSFVVKLIFVSYRHESLVCLVRDRRRTDFYAAAAVVVREYARTGIETRVVVAAAAA